MLAAHILGPQSWHTENRSKDGIASKPRQQMEGEGADSGIHAEPLWEPGAPLPDPHFAR